MLRPAKARLCLHESLGLGPLLRLRDRRRLRAGRTWVEGQRAHAASSLSLSLSLLAA